MNKRFNLWTAATMVENKDYLNTSFPPPPSGGGNP